MLQKLPPVGAELIVTPMKIKGGSGGPCRVFAKIPNHSSRLVQSQLLLILASFVVALQHFL